MYIEVNMHHTLDSPSAKASPSLYKQLIEKSKLTMSAQGCHQPKFSASQIWHEFESKYLDKLQ